MYQVLLRYLEDRYASFFVDSPIKEFSDLVQRIRRSVPLFNQIPDEEIRISYKDIELQCYINIEPEEPLHLVEAFRNSRNSGSELYRRIELHVRERDSPYVIKKRASLLLKDKEDGATKTDPRAKTSLHLQLQQSTCSSVVSQSSTESGFNQAKDWKDSKLAQINEKLQCLNDKKIALETHVGELSLEIVEPPRVGSYNVVCGKCHIRGHRSEGNRGNNSCKSPPCNSYFMCGQKKKHPEHFEAIKKANKQLKDLRQEVESVTMEKKNLESFQSKSISAFSTAITPRLLKAFGERYNPKTAAGKLDLQRDITTLRNACGNTIPPHTSTANDREVFETLLNNEKEKMGKFAYSLSSTTATSPLITHYKKRSASSESNSDDERRKRKKRKRSHKKKRGKSSKKRRRDYSSSSSESEVDYRHHRRHESSHVNRKSTETSTNVSATAVSSSQQCCSLNELATIAVAIENSK